MYSKLKISDARGLLKLTQGENIPYSAMSKELADELCTESILSMQTNGSRKRLRILNQEALNSFLAQSFGLQVPLYQWIETMETGASRAQMVELCSDSKYKLQRSFPGFLLKACNPIKAEYRGEPITLKTLPGTSLFVEDYKSLFIDPKVIIVGVENGENFQKAEYTQHFFPYDKTLFVSRYPQSGDLKAWLQSIRNQYIHFGDFDLAGINIYLSEYFSVLGNRASFFIPDNIEELLSKGNSQLYNKQYQRYKDMKVTDSRLTELVNLINHYRKTYEQEGLLI